MAKVLVAPSILAADFANLTEEVHRVEEAGADWIHCDIMDGHFVDNISFGPMVVGVVRKQTKLPLDVHLMIEHADHYVPRFVEAGANSITVHPGFGGQPFRADQMEKVKRTVEWNRSRDRKIDIEVDGGINPETARVSIQNGANVLVAGTSIFRAKDYAKAIRDLRGN